MANPREHSNIAQDRQTQEKEEWFIDYVNFLSLIHDLLRFESNIIALHNRFKAILTVQVVLWPNSWSPLFFGIEIRRSCPTYTIQKRLCRSSWAELPKLRSCPKHAAHTHAWFGNFCSLVLLDLDVVLRMSPFDPCLGMMPLDQYMFFELQLTNQLINMILINVNSPTIPLPQVHFGVWVIEVIKHNCWWGKATPNLFLFGCGILPRQLHIKSLRGLQAQKSIEEQGSFTDSQARCLQEEIPSQKWSLVCLLNFWFPSCSASPSSSLNATYTYTQLYIGIFVSILL